MTAWHEPRQGRTTFTGDAHVDPGAGADPSDAHRGNISAQSHACEFDVVPRVPVCLVSDLKEQYLLLWLLGFASAHRHKSGQARSSAKRTRTPHLVGLCAVLAAERLAVGAGEGRERQLQLPHHAGGVLVLCGAWERARRRGCHARGVVDVRAVAERARFGGQRDRVAAHARRARLLILASWRVGGISVSGPMRRSGQSAGACHIGRRGQRGWRGGAAWGEGHRVSQLATGRRRLGEHPGAHFRVWVWSKRQLRSIMGPNAPTGTEPRP